MKFKWDKKYLYWGVTAFCVVALSILFFLAVTQWSTVRKIFHKLNVILNPIVVGIIIAYILSPILNFFEKRLFLKLGHKAFPQSDRSAKVFGRVTGIAAVILIMMALLALIIIFVLPQLYYSIQKLVLSMQDYYNTVAAWLSETFNKNVGTGTMITNILLNAKDYFINWVNTGLLRNLQNIVINVSTGIVGVLLSIFDFFLGMIISIYVMYRKEEFLAMVKKITYSILSEKRSIAMIKAVEHIHRTFGQFLVGKLINSLIMGLLCAIFMVIFKMPYAALISVIIGATDMIPFLGPYMGSIPSILLVLLEDPVKCAIFALFLLILHSFNGNIMEPRIIGTSTGMSGFWILFSILFFGGLFGFIGMLCGVPIFAVIYTSFGSWCTRQLKRKNFPTETAAYEKHGPVEPEERW